MPETDNPLKVLVRDFAPDFAAWLLNVEPEAVQSVRALNIELPAGAVRSDTVFYVTLTDGREVLLHIEFQGERSERPMPWRMLDYLGKIAERELDYRHLARVPLCAAVLYVGDGAGVHDTGDYRIGCADGGLTLAWRYRVIRLWQMRAEELLALGRPALLTLIGQTRIEEPARVVPQAVAAIGQVADDEERAGLFAAFTSLLRDEEVIEMAERLMEAMDRGLLMDTPFLRRIRTESEARGETRGEAKGRTEGRTEGRIEELRQIILDVLATRLEPSLAAYRRIEARVAAINEIERLRSLVQAAVSAANTVEFERVLGG
jgi:predicted transposase YdaD